MLAALASAPNVLILTLTWTLLQACLNLVLAALGAIVPDQIPVRQRATASAFVGLSAPVSILLGDILIAVLVTSTSLSYYTIMGLLLIVMLLFVLVMRDPVLPAEAAPPLRICSFLTSFWINPMRYPDFGWTWLTRFLVYLSYNLTFSYLLYYVQDALHYEQLFPGQRASQGIAILQLITTGTSLLAAIGSGVLSDRLQRRKVFVMCASIFIALSLLSLAFFRNWQEVEIVAVFLGIGLGSYFAVDNALVTQVITSTSVRGKDMSVLNIANALPAALAPTIGAIILIIVHSYTPFFVLAGILASLGAVLVLPIKSVR
jgi:MFS family permease